MSQSKKNIKKIAYRWLKPFIDKGMIEPNCLITDVMRGTTAGTVHIVSTNGEPAYVLKTDNQALTDLASRFLMMYRHLPLVPAWIGSDPAQGCLLYSYVPGTTDSRQRVVKRDWLLVLAEKLNT